MDEARPLVRARPLVEAAVAADLVEAEAAVATAQAAEAALVETLPRRQCRTDRTQVKLRLTVPSQFRTQVQFRLTVPSQFRTQVQFRPQAPRLRTGALVQQAVM
jgi:outer membrane usher protein FimD/PapC